MWLEKNIFVLNVVGFVWDAYELDFGVCVGGHRSKVTGQRIVQCRV